jgi:pilus assembly protein Flp/PilA
MKIERHSLMKKLIKKFAGFVKNEEGQGLVEYALILALVALLVIIALKFLGGTVANTYNNIGNALS